MKKISFLLLISLFLLSSCAFHDGLTRNVNSNTTEVVLSQKNFKVIGTVQGQSKATYVLSIGGLSKQALIAEARAKMLSKADIAGSSKAVINETVEVKRSFLPIVRIYSITVSGHIVEFIQ